MTKTIVRVLLIAAIFVGAFASASNAEQAGYVLVDRLVTYFEQIAHTGTGGVGSVHQTLGELMTLARKARDERQITPAFFERYARVLRVMKLSMTIDPEGILRPVVERETREFVKDVTGKDSTDLGSLAEAYARELDDLRAGVSKK